MHIHILGIAGTMTAPLAVALKKEGHLITGSDQEKIYPPVSTILKKSNIKINSQKIDSTIDLAIIGGSYSSFQKTKEEFEQIKKLKIKYISASEFIAQKLIKENSVLIAGTYGKTTITSLVSWIFCQSNFNPNYMFGGEAINHFPSTNISSSNWSVVEADESIHGLDNQAKFLYYPVKFLTLTSADWEHKDSYSTEIANFNAFKKLITNVPENGFLLVNSKGFQTKELSLYSKTRIITYNSSNSDYYLKHIKIKKSYSVLNIRTPRNIIEIKTKLIGQFNFENILAAVALTDSLNINQTIIKKAIFNFKGIKRRIEKIYDQNKITIFDDFAQSSNRIKSTLESIKSHFPKRNIKILYQPHASFIQYKESLKDFKNAFSLASEIVLSKINYNHNIDKNNRTTAKDFRDIIGSKLVYIPIDEDIINFYKQNLKSGDILINMSSGGLNGNNIVKSVINYLK
ncbi:MAG TPA: Mur ligase family protein [Candidatus Woesebacteria bacterium]|nr:Mur ligase family protein [Candidatus Woesebacteria bacterium]